MCEKVRNLRSNLCTKVKNSIFKTFGRLPQIKSNADPEEIAEWKRNPEVAESYKKLFKDIDGTSEKYIARIIQGVWPKKEEIPDSHTAWCISIAEIFLNPNNKHIQISENIIRPDLVKNMVSSRNN